MDSLTFLDRVARLKPQPIYVVHGDEFFLKRQVLVAMRALVLGPEADGFGLTSFPGDKATFAAVRNELTTLPFISPRRLVVVENADLFITAERKKLEKYIEAPSPTGVLVLDVKTWTATTNLAKMVSDAATIACKTPAAARLPDWCQKWCSAQYAKQLTPQAGRLLVDLVGADMGLLDQELNKLSLYVGAAESIDVAEVDRLVNNSRSEDAWKIFNLIGTGQAGSALTLLDRLLTQGEEPIRLLGAFSSQLRKLAQTARLNSQGQGLRTAMDQAGIPNWDSARQGAEQLLRHLGRRRLDQLFDWLIQTDLGMKTTAQLSPRLLMERLVVQLARSNQTR